MTISDHPAPPPRRRRLLPAALASLVGSVAVHAAFAAAAVGIAWRLSQDSAPVTRDVVIRFEDPSAAEGDEALPSRPQNPAAAGIPPAPVLPDPPHITPPQVAATPPSPAGELPPSLLADSSDRLTPRPQAAEPGRAAPTSPSSPGLLAGAEADSGGVRFAGLGASNARSVVYVVDASGPMVTSMPRVIQELRRSVDQLSPSQKFGVVLFRRTETGAGAEVFAPVLMRATPSAKRRLVDWLAQAAPVGASNPLTGLEAALALKPDVVFLLSRSIARSGGGVWEDGLESTLARLEHLNPPSGPAGRRPTLIQTIQFLDDDPTGIMQAIGARHGQGAGYRVVRRGEDIAGQAR